MPHAQQPQPRPGEIEREFGVPIPGRILPPEQWAKTALKKLPPGVWDWQALFGRSTPIVIDIGCGNGRSTLGSAVARPEYDHLGIDILPVVIRYATRRGNQRGLSNLRFAVIGGRELLAEHVPAGSVAELHIYHPQPYYEAGERGKRLLTPEFLARAWTVLRPGGLLVLQTDNKPYWKYLLAAVRRHFEPAVRPGPWPDAPRGRTRREIQARRKGLAVWRMEARRRDVPLDVAIPAPDFDADRPRFRRRRGMEDGGDPQS